MMTDNSHKAFPVREICITHEVSDLAVLRFSREAEPYDYFHSVPESLCAANTGEYHIKNSDLQ